MFRRLQTFAAYDMNIIHLINFIRNVNIIPVDDFQKQISNISVSKITSAKQISSSQEEQISQVRQDYRSPIRFYKR